MKNKKMIALSAAVLVFGSIIAGNTVAAQASTGTTGEKSGIILDGYNDIEVLTAYKKDKYNDKGCTMVLPTGYTADESIKGMYVSNRDPLDSSNIYYSVLEDIDVEALRDTMNTESYRNDTEKKFKEAYGEEAVIESYELKETKVDGCPAYTIRLSCTLEDMLMEQLTYMVLADKAYTITFSQASDDGRMEEFERSAETLRIVFEE